MANEYITLTELKDIRQITDADSDAMLQKRITRASRAIDDRTGRRFYADGVASARTFRVADRLVCDDDGAVLLVDDIASTLGLVVELGDGTSWSPYTDYDAEPENAIARGRAITGLRRIAGGWNARRARVTADWGWPAVPDGIAEATLLLANRRFMRRDSPEGVAGWAQDGPVRVSRFDPDIEDLVGPYVLPGFA
jgi:hypothetical protein